MEVEMYSTLRYVLGWDGGWDVFGTSRMLWQGLQSRGS